MSKLTNVFYMTTAQFSTLKSQGYVIIDGVRYNYDDNAMYITPDDSPSIEFVIAWDGESTPDVTKIPAGIQVTYSGTTYTGTLAAAASLVGKFYLVSKDTTSTIDKYNAYTTILEGSTYKWEAIEVTIDLSNVVQYTAQSKTDAEKAIARNNIGAQEALELTIIY